MVRHIVLWNLKDEALGHTKEENIALLKEKFAAIDGKIDGMLSIEVTANFVPGGVDACLLCTFVNREALDSYQVNPLHLEIKKFVHQVITERFSHDAEL